MAHTNNNDSLTGLEIAVIGMAGRFPGAKNLDRFWDNLEKGIEAVTFFHEDELKESGIAPGLTRCFLTIHRRKRKSWTPRFGCFTNAVGKH